MLVEIKTAEEMRKQTEQNEKYSTQLKTAVEVLQYNIEQAARTGKRETLLNYSYKKDSDGSIIEFYNIEFNFVREIRELFEPLGYTIGARECDRWMAHPGRYIFW